jgi:hypothetical protein
MCPFCVLLCQPSLDAENIFMPGVKYYAVERQFCCVMYEDDVTFAAAHSGLSAKVCDGYVTSEHCFAPDFDFTK